MTEPPAELSDEGGKDGAGCLLGQAVCDRFSVTSRFRDRAWPSENFVALKNLDAALLRTLWLFFTADNDPRLA